MSNTNQENSTSEALNVAIQTMVHVLPPNLKPEKPVKFDGTEFKRWQQKLLFDLTTLHLVKFL